MTARQLTSPLKVHGLKSSGHITWPMPLNESYACPPDAEQSYSGKRFRIYSTSHFRDYLSRSTFATDEYPGPLRHFEICCEAQIVNVVSTVSPTITVTAPRAHSEQRQRFRI